MAKSLKIGNVLLERPLILAPLAGFTDKTMRTLCTEQGASLTFTEMVSCKGLKYGDRKTGKLLEIGPDEGPVAYQVFGSEPDILEYAAETLGDRKNYSNVILDLNCGCPVPKIVRNGEGSALLKDLDLLYRNVEALVRGSARRAGLAGPVPVTAKIRMGFERGSDVAVEAARAIEAAGAAAVTLHGRTREQYYEGKADWQAIARVKAAVKIPVIGNGDIMCGRDAVRMMEETGCDGVMIARGALGNPWIFREACLLLDEDLQSLPADYRQPSPEDRISMLIRHLDMLIADKGERVAVREIRKFVGYYTRGLHGAAALRRQVNNMTDPDQIKALLEGC